MRRLATLFLLIAISCVTVVPTTSVQADTGRISSPIVLEDRSANAARLLEAAEAALEKLEGLEAAENMEGLNLSEALRQSLPAGDVEAFKKRFRTELRLARFPDRAYAWRDASDAYRDAGRLEDAYGAAWYMLQLASSPREEAAALDMFVKIMLAQSKIEDAMTTLRETQAISRSNNRQTWLNAVSARFTLRVVDQSIDVEGASPQACLVLSHEMDLQTTRLEDFVRVNGVTDIAVEGKGDRICLTGLTHGDKIDVTLLSGLPGKQGARLYTDAKRSFTVPDRPARVLFGNGTYILPQVGDETVPLKSVNVDEATLKLFRIPDRGLVAWLSSGYEGTNLTNWAQRNLSDTLGESVWEGSVDIDSTKNQDVTTLVPIREMLTSVKPGVYALVAATEEDKKQHNWIARQTQWLVISDIGIMSLQGADGMHVFLHSLESTKPLRNVTVTILGRNNDILAETRSNRQGQVTIAAELLRGTGGNTPVLLAARSRDGDFSFMKLQGPALDLSDRGAEGRSANSPLDAFIYTERGIYRPGEKVYLSALLRDAQARAVGNTALSLIVTRPDGVEALKTRLTGNALGAYAYDYDLSAAARTGMWRASLHADDDANSIGETRFQVDAFVPERMTATLDTVEEQLMGGSPLEVHVQADFLYGAPGADLDGTLTASLVVDPEPFSEWKAYSFGLVQEEFEPEQLARLPFKTGETGLARVALLANQLPATTLPLRVRLAAEVEDVGGRPVGVSDWRPVERPPLMIGIQAAKPGGFEDGDQAQLSVVTVNADGRAVGGQSLTAVWVKERYSYTWYHNRGRWQYRTSLFEEVIGEESIQTGTDGTVDLSRSLPWGRYRLDVMGPDGTAASSSRFTVGWWARSDSPDVPDGLELTIEEETLAAGDRVQGFVKAPFEGTAIITVANDRLLETKTITLDKEGSSFDFRVKADWGPSAYIIATALRPNAGDISRLPVRATGLAWFSVDREQRSRKIEIAVPDVALPGEPVTIPIKMRGGSPEGAVTVTLAAVDEGILNITRHRSPNPDAFYFGKRAFGYDMRDLYGRLIRSEEGVRGTIRTGGDRMMFDEVLVSGTKRMAEDNLASNITRTRKTVALISRDIRLNRDGEGSVTLDIPDFMGSMRLMAVATSVDAVGTGSASLTVRTPVVADLITPRFLAPGDQAHATFSIQNLSGKAGSFRVSLASDTPTISVALPQDQFTLKDGERQDITVPLTGNTVGTASISLVISGSEMVDIKRRFEISVRPAWPFTTQRAVLPLEPGASGTLDGIDLDAFHAGTLHQSLAVSSRPNLEAGRLFRELTAYPYWCSEQTVSRAMPALFHEELNALYGLSLDASQAKNMIESSIMILLDRQKSNGSFGLWSSYGGGSVWLDAYVADFLSRAAEKGYFVPEAALVMARNRLQWMTNQRGRGFLEATAYAHYVLARSGHASASDVRYFADQFGGKLASPMALAHMGGALGYVGEAEVSQRFFIRAVRKERPTRHFRGDYGSSLRDMAAVTALIAEQKGDAGHLASLSDRLEADVATDQWLSTQEMAWLARAAASFAVGGAGEIQFAVAAEAHTANHGYWRRDLKSGVSLASAQIENTGGTPVKAVHLVRGVSKQEPKPAANGFSHNRSFFDMQGKPLNPERLPRGERFVVLLWGQATAKTIEDPLIVDLLPAGLEIDSTDTSSLKFLSKLSRVEFSDARDDRFVAALKIRPGSGAASRSYKVAYIVRAVTPGTYVLPGAFVEDMYQPQYRLQGAAARLIVED